MENLELVQKLKLELIREYDKFVRAIRALTGVSLDEAREALQSAICRVLAGVTRVGPGNPIVAWRPYVLRTAMNELRKERNERKRVILFSEMNKEERGKLLAIPDPQPMPQKHLQDTEIAAILWAEVEILSPREGDVLKRWAHGSSFQDISGALGIEPSTARVLWSRGIRHLRKRPRVQQLAA